MTKTELKTAISLAVETVVIEQLEQVFLALKILTRKIIKLLLNLLSKQTQLTLGQRTQIAKNIVSGLPSHKKLEVPSYAKNLNVQNVNSQFAQPYQPPERIINTGNKVFSINDVLLLTKRLLETTGGYDNLGAGELY